MEKFELAGISDVGSYLLGFAVGSLYDAKLREFLFKRNCSLFIYLFILIFLAHSNMVQVCSVPGYLIHTFCELHHWMGHAINLSFDCPDGVIGGLQNG